MDLIIDSADFGMALPVWEEYELDIDPYEKNTKLWEHLKMPDWVKVFPRSQFKLAVDQVAVLFRMVRDYDLLHLHPFSPLFLQFQSKPFVIHEAGWLRALCGEDNNSVKLARRAYARAESVVMTNPDLYGVLPHFKHKSDIFIPFVIDTDYYRPAQKKAHRSDSEGLLFFSPARHVWDIKGNDKLIRGFAKYLAKRRRNARLILTNWGLPEDLVRSRQLIRKLGIADAIEWVNPLSKPRLIQIYQNADATFDQYVIGGYGTAGPEAMACGSPLVTYFRPYWNLKCYGELAPVLNAFTDDEIAQRMMELEDEETRLRHGKAGREYVLKHHAPQVLAKRYVEFYRGMEARLS